MIRSAVTISLVPQAKGGPFVFWDDLEAGCRAASDLGFDAVEVFAPGPDAVSPDRLRQLLTNYHLQLAAVGTGSGWVIHRLTLTSADAGERQRARDSIRSMIDFGGPFGAPAIIGSMQGRWGNGAERDAARDQLRDALDDLGQHAKQYGVPLLYEPLNRYETNLVSTVADGVTLLQSLATENVKLLADLFHMNIEEVSLADAVRTGRGHIGHVHFVDSNRRPAGCGHIDYAPVAAALREIDFNGYASAEALPYPDSMEAARLTMATFRKHFRPA
ncbi:MAG: sugar phosphate isomerase/epimerase [Planctomycetales bacterium]|nr:sugar phosphate isomerase/epimerase [Planctomycetales bacterium]